MSQQKAQISGWGNFPTATCMLLRPERLHQLENNHNKLIARGLGRSYGDAALNTDHGVVLMERLNRFLHFDAASGLLRAEAGCTLREILDTFVPRGWFLPVTPGTKFATLGGCLAADVHGKNHHCDGAFSCYVKEFEIQLANGTVKKCSKQQESPLFWATAGGMGLTGIITEMTLQLVPLSSAYIQVTHYQTKTLEETIDTFNDSSRDDKYSVAWIDCLSTGENSGRSIVMNGHHIDAQELSPKIKDPLSLPNRTEATVPFYFPSFALNPWSVKAFNTCYYTAQAKKSVPFITDYDRYFYPLDTIHEWNRIYGKKGFLQYQCVVPMESGKIALRKILDKLNEHCCSSFLAVLKKFGAHNPGPLSFPTAGYTLALDIPIKDPSIFAFLDQLDQIVIEYGGKVYLAKDARLSHEAFRAMYPRFDEWHAIKSLVDPKNRMQSDLYKRVMIGGKR